MVKRKLRYFFIALLCALFAFALTAALAEIVKEREA